jgi:type I restriction enzyme, S subunit
MPADAQRCTIRECHENGEWKMSAHSPLSTVHSPLIPPGYKQTEVGVIPEEWEVTTIIDCCDYADYRGKTPPKTQSGTFLVTARNVRKGFIDYMDSQEFVPSALYDVIMRRGKPCIGDVLITTEAPLGNVAQIDREDVALAQRIIKYRPKLDELSSTYLKHYFLSDRFQQILDDHSSGSTAKGIKGRVLHQLPVVIPPLPEQRAIATALSDVDALLAGLDRLLAKKRDLKQAAMQQLLTGQTRLPGFKGKWEVKRLGEICEIAMGRTPPRLNQAFWGHGYKWLSIADLQSKVVSDSKEEITELAASTMTIIPKGTLLMSFKLSLGRLCFAGCDLFTNEAICSFNKVQANADFLYYVLRRTDFSLYGKQAVKGYTLNKESLRIIEVSLPPLPEQTAIAEVLTDMDAELAALEQRREKTRALKQAMMQELLTGKTRLISRGVVEMKP